MKSFFSWLCLYFVAPLLFITAGLYAFFSILNPQTIKDTLKEEGVYTAIVPAALTTTANTNVSTAELPLKEPWVQNAAEKAFPADDLEQKTNTVIDSTFEWLDGKSETPTFKIDLAPNKAAFAAEVGNYAQNRYSGLPSCSRNNLPKSTDPLAVDCRVQGISAGQISETLSQRVIKDKDFLANPVLSADNASLNPVNQTVSKNPFEQLEGLRSLYQSRIFLMIVLPLLIVLFAVLGIFLAPNKVRGFNRLSRSFLVSAVSMVLIGFLLGIGLERVVDVFAFDAITSNVLGPVITSLGAHARNVYFIFAGISVVAAIGSFIGARFLKQRNAAISEVPRTSVNETRFQ